ncbi:sigma-70 family RNA polymerase sigma factor [Pantoea coffeiphila]|uniref:sigma-70 family RNA polymerase sigma factor n=1 Tax=Pantoea coffeiphila TaxID=1465635 RepID=UPI0019603119|nr:sigma-70 family RNA polymerase sigma factor [Pantoea coffeiphila]MBM7343219.1 RNA polymerase sigma-70 factor (ECF subfamily) [Pantoea coffeiphila]
MARKQSAASHGFAEQLYLEHHSWLCSWLRNRVSCASHAEDLAQDTFLGILLSPQLLTIREPRPFLATVARRLVANFYRRKKIEEHYLQALAELPEEAIPSPEVRQQAIEMLEQLDRALDGLPPHVREAFLLAHLQGMRYSDIAERLRVSTSSVKQYLQRANLHCFFALSA